MRWRRYFIPPALSFPALKTMERGGRTDSLEILKQTGADLRRSFLPHSPVKHVQKMVQRDLHLLGRWFGVYVPIVHPECLLIPPECPFRHVPVINLLSDRLKV